jgi:ATP-dependent Clp protease ATP-binding subunit ClpA
MSQEEARLLKHNYIGTEHVLMGMLHEHEGIAAKALQALGVTLEATRNQIEEIVGTGDMVPLGHIPFTPRAKKVLELSLREALQLGHNYIGTEHLLLALVREGEGVAIQVLKTLGVEPQIIRQEIIKTLSKAPLLKPKGKSPDISPEQILQWKQLVSKATPGPIVSKIESVDDFHLGGMVSCTLRWPNGNSIYVGGRDRADDFAFFAAAREALPLLLGAFDAAESLKEENETLKKRIYALESFITESTKNE